jgi:hypothetical protein
VPAPGVADPLLRFYRLEGPDARGRMLAEIWAWDDTRLEAVHDYIQWLFPLRERSAFNPAAPVLTPATIAAFLTDRVLHDRLRRSFERMLRFYGLRMTGEAGTRRVEPAADFPARGRTWLQPADHNHLRLTRILASVRLLGLAEESRALAACLRALPAAHPGAVSQITLEYWRQAALDE